MSEPILLCEDNEALHKWLMDRQVGKLQVGGSVVNARNAFGKACASMIANEFERIKLENHGMIRYSASITGKFEVVPAETTCKLACAICFNKPMSMCALPCKHAYLCDVCSEFTTVHESMRHCALCREDIEEVQKVEDVGGGVFKCGVQQPDEAHILFEHKGKKYRDNVLVIGEDVLKECLDTLSESEVADSASALAVGQPAAFWALANLAKKQDKDTDEMYPVVRELETGGRRKRRRR